MALKIVVSNSFKFKVKGTIKDEAGSDQPFHFGLTCSRMDSEQIQDKLRKEGNDTIVEFMGGVIQDWEGVKDADDKPLPYTEENLHALCLIPGMAGLMLRGYLAEVGTKEKN